MTEYGPSVGLGDTHAKISSYRKYHPRAWFGCERRGLWLITDVIPLDSTLNVSPTTTLWNAVVGEWHFRADRSGMFFST